MFKIKYYLFLSKRHPQFFLGIIMILLSLDNFKSNFMNLKETKKNLTSEIKKELKKSNLEVLTNENDFLVKNLKKAG